MKKLLAIALLSLSSRSSYAFFPYQEAADKVTDTAILSSSITSLAEEIGVSSELLTELNAVKTESNLLEDQIALSRTITDEVYGLRQPNFSKGKKVSNNIDSVTRYVRRVKNLGSLILRIGGRPEASTAVSLMETNNLLFSMLQGQERESLSREKEKLVEERRVQSERVAVATFVDDELKRINEHADQRDAVSGYSHRRRR